MYTEFNYIQLSAVQHYLFCPRQCTLAYVELNWEENHLTTQGHLMHETVHHGDHKKRGDLIQSRGLFISSHKYGLSGQCDLVEFHWVGDCDILPVETEGLASLQVGQNIKRTCVKLPHYSGVWIPFPVEYKRGKPKINNCDRVQLCAQALCIEEMLECTVEKGALYYGEKHHREDVLFSEALRKETVSVIEAVHALFLEGKTPRPEYSPKCRSCSLLDRCQPKQYEHRRCDKYIDSIFEDV